MHPSIIITDLNGSRRVEDEALPLNVGTDNDAHIRLPGWEGTGRFAQISVLDDRCFVQPQNPDIQLKLNGVSLVTPKWFNDGDVLSVGDAEIEIHDDGEEIEIEVFLSSEEAETIPPDFSSAHVSQNDAADSARHSAAETFAADNSGHSAVDLVARAVARRNTEALQGDHLPAARTEQQEDQAGPSVAHPDSVGELADRTARLRPEAADTDSLKRAPEADVMAPLPGENEPVRKAAAPPAAKPKKRNGFIWLCWILLLLAIAYVALSSKVTIATFPAGADVRMEPRWLAPGRAGRFFLIPGSYDYVASADGYQSVRGSFAVEFLERKTLSVELVEMPGRLSFRLPEGLDGELWINGEPFTDLDQLPAALPKGSYDFRIVSDLYQDYTGEVEILGRDELQVIQPELLPQWGSFAVATQPPGADIYFGEQLLGTTPATVDVKAGTHELELRLNGYQPLRKTVNSVAGEVEILPMIELQQLGASIALTTSPAGALVNSGGQYLGTTPLTIPATADQSMSLEISRPGYQSVVREVRVAGNETLELDVSMVALQGAVVVEASPRDAMLFVNGRSMGAANQELTLPAVQQEIEIRREGFQTWASRVTPTPGIPQRIDVSLLTAAQARLANLPATLTSSLEQKLVLVRPGRLTLGSASGSQGRRANEVIRNVELQRPFYIGTSEVTNRQFGRFNGQHSSATDEYPGLGAPNQPVVMISWSEAAAYCNWLSDREGLPRAYVMEAGDLKLAEPANAGYRLPTEAEWAWVARFAGGLAGERRFPWGVAMPPTSDAGNFADASAIEYFPNALLNYADGAPLATEVESYTPNELGVFDLGGNVAEWTNDYYSSAPAPDILIDPVGPQQGQSWVIRGSSWQHSAVSDLRLTARDFGAGPRVDVGFRLARYAPQIEVSETNEQTEIN